MNTLRRIAIGFVLAKLGVLVSNLSRFPVLRESIVDSDPDFVLPVSLLVPVRNEADTLAAYLPALLRQNVAEVIILDDQSTDGSRWQAQQLIAGRERCRVVAGSAPPPLWTGKNWACHQLADLAACEVLIFCDADVRLVDGALARVMDALKAQHADLLSVFPRQTTVTWGEHLVAPLIDDAVLCLLPFALLSIDVPSAATANGSVLAFTREAYDRVGGFAAVRRELVEDVALARRARRVGLKLGLVLGGDQIGTRMYSGYLEAVVGLGRGLTTITGRRRGLLIAGLIWHLLVYTLPWVMAPRRPRWLILVVLGLAERVLVEAKTGRWQLWQSLLTPLAPIAATPIVIQSLRRTQTWKGRSYS